MATSKEVTDLGMQSRVGTSHSNLETPDSPIYNLAAEFQNYMHLPDPTPLYAVLGAMAGNMLTGTPIWLMLIGASGCGKTKLLKSLIKIPRVRMVSSIKGEAALMSGTKKKERAADASGGILCELKDNGCMVFMDFTTVLSKSREAVNELLGALRELFDRTWSRDIGGEGGRNLRHTGIVNLIAGCTHAIDRHMEVAKEMGERCLYFRYPHTDGYQESRAAANCVNAREAEEAMQEMVEAMFYALDLSFEKQQTRRRLETWESDKIVMLAQLGAAARTPVPRDSYTRQVVDIAAVEVSTRLSAQMAQLYLGMEVIGVEGAERWRLLEKVTLDSMPLLRKMTLLAVAGGVGSGNAVARKIKVSESAAKRAMEDLEVLGLVRKVTPDRVGVTEWAKERLTEAVLGIQQQDSGGESS